MPAGIDIDLALGRVREMITRLSSGKRPASAGFYHDGWTYTYPEGTITVKVTDSARPTAKVRLTGHDIIIEAGKVLDFERPDVNLAISGLIKKASGYLAAPILLPQARETAARLNAGPDTWEVGRGVRTLGTCYNRERRIRLSSTLLFLPHELREYVICHELAHLTHADHSAAFHSLCDTYCGGREKLLIRAMKAWKWPIIR